MSYALIATLHQINNVMMNLTEINKRKERIAQTITWILFSAGISYIFAALMLETYGF